MRHGLWLSALFTLAGCGSAPPPKTAGTSDPKQPRITVGNTLDCGKQIHYVKPSYPKQAKKRRLQGTVRLRVVITKLGDLRDFQVLSGDPLLVPAAVAAVKQWRYTPCLLNSEPIEVITIIELNFIPGQ